MWMPRPTLIALSLAMLMSWTGAGTAAAHGESAQALAQRIVAEFNAPVRAHEGFQNFCDAFCEPGFRRLIAHANDKDGVLDYDPFCQCQDSGGAYAIQSITEMSKDEYQVQLTERSKHDAWDLVLRRTPAGWKVYDVIEFGTNGLGSLRRRLIHPD